MTEGTVEAGGYLNEKYGWTRDGNVRSPFLNVLDPDFLPSPSWINDFIKANSKLGAEEVAKNLPENSNILFALAAKLDSVVVPEPEKRTLGDYFDILVDDQDDLPTCRDVDLEKKIIISDKAFAQYRLSGPNPLAIRLATVEDLHTFVPELKNEKILLKLAQEKQLFVVDYSLFASVKVGRSFFEGLSKAALGSVALFRKQDNGLAPVCIRVISSTGQTKLFQPDDHNGRKKNGFGWEIAKCVFNSNETYFHQSWAHVGRCHLVVEIFLVATFRRFPENHPLYKLLTPHVEGTAFINDIINSAAFGEQGTFDALSSYDRDETCENVLSLIESFTASDMRFPERIKARQMDVDTVPGLDYPYRDDGILIWNAIRKWVGNYVEIFYPNDDAVAADKSVRNWIGELTTNGGVRWLDNFEYTVEWLSDVIASFICLTSFDHASVHFTQRDWMQFTPTFSLSIYEGDSVVFKDKPTEEDYLSLLPPKAFAKSQAEANFMYSFVYTRLGQYDAQVPWNSPGDHFRGIVGGDGLIVPADYLDRVNEALLKFQGDLDSASEEIQKRNESRESPYTAMLPGNLPQSINV